MSKVIEWLSPPDSSADYIKALQQRQKYSGLWFVKDLAFATWIEKRNSFLWLHGMAGSGKTILSSTIIEKLDETVPHLLLYFYFDSSDPLKLTLDSLVRSLIYQLYIKHEKTTHDVDSLFSACQNGHHQPNSKQLRDVLLGQIDQVKEVFIVLDALDECNTKDELLSMMRDMLKSKKCNVHLLATSRPEGGIQINLANWGHGNFASIQCDPMMIDIHAYIRTKVREGEGLKKWRSQPDVQRLIEARLLERSDGMFRWVACQLDALEHCPDLPALREVLISLPCGSSETFARILSTIPKDSRQLVVRVLQFLLFSKRPLRFEEIVDAVAVGTDGDYHFSPSLRMPIRSQILRDCSGLVVVRFAEDYSHKNDITPVDLEWAHKSAKQYLTSSRWCQEDIAPYLRAPVSEASIAGICLAYLFHLDQARWNILIEKRFRSKDKIRKEFPLAEYSASYWMVHASKAESQDKNLQVLIKKVLCQRGLRCVNLYDLYQPDESCDYRIGVILAKTLDDAWNRDSTDVVEFLMALRADVIAESGQGRSRPKYRGYHHTHWAFRRQYVVDYEDSTEDWTLEGEHTFMNSFIELIRRELPQNLLNTLEVQEFDEEILKELEHTLEEFSDSVAWSDAHMSPFWNVSKYIGRFCREISKQRIEEICNDTDFLESPSESERADGHEEEQKMFAKDIKDRKTKATPSLLSDGLNLPRLEKASEADVISPSRSGSSTPVSVEQQYIQSLFVNHAAFSDLVKNIERLLGRYSNDQMGIIGERISRSLKYFSGLHEVSFTTDWKLVKFLEDEYDLGLQQNLGRVLALTGGPVNAQLVPVVTYLKQTWSSYPLDLLEAIHADLQRIAHSKVSRERDSSFNDALNGNNVSPTPNSIRANLKKREFAVTGSEDFIAVVAQQLSWLSAACRRDFMGLAYVEFECDTSPINEVSPRFNIRIHNGLAKPSKACWTSIVHDTVVVRGFPFPPRGNFIGLQAPLEVLADLIGISLAMRHDGGLILKGRSHIIVPVKRTGDEVQWHLIDRYPKKISFNEIDGIGDRVLIDELDEVDLQSTKAFLGWCRKGVNMLGTTNSLHCLDSGADPKKVSYNYGAISYSGMLKESTHELVFKGVSLGFSKIGSGQVNYDYRKRQCIFNTATSGSYRLTLGDAKGLHVILHDTEYTRAWHTNAERLILHLILHRQSQDWFEIDGEPVEVEPANENAGISVRDATWKNANMALFQDWKSGKDKPSVWRFRDMFEELLRTLEELQHQQKGARPDGELKLSLKRRRSLLGWEYMDLVERKRDLHLKSTKVEATFGQWPRFAHEIGAVILFGSGFQEILTPMYPDELCLNFQTLPVGKGYLAMEISAIRELYKQEGSQNDQARLSSTLMWQRSSQVFERCNEIGESEQHPDKPCKCMRVQELEETSGKPRRPGEVDAFFGNWDGAVIFGGSAGLVESLLSKSQSKFRQKQCREDSDRNPEQPEPKSRHTPFNQRPDVASGTSLSAALDPRILNAGPERSLHISLRSETASKPENMCPGEICPQGSKMEYHRNSGPAISESRQYRSERHFGSCSEHPPLRRKGRLKISDDL